MCIIKKEIERIGLPCSGLEGKKECEKCPCNKESDIDEQLERVGGSDG